MKTLKMIAVFLAVLAAMSFAKKIPVEAHVKGGGATVSVDSQFELGKSFTATVTPINGYAINAVYIEANYESIDSTGQVIVSHFGECSQTATNVYTCEVPDYDESYFSIDFWVSTYGLTSYSITNNSASGTYGYLSAPSSALENDYVQLTPKITNNGYEVDYVWYCEAAASTTCSGTKTEVSLKDGKYYFPMPTYNVLVGVEFKPINYTIKKSTVTNGSLAVTKPTDLTKAHVKDSVILTPSAGTGYEVDYVWYCKAASSTTCSGTQTKVSLKDGKYYFHMPTYNVLVGAEFKPINYTIKKSTVTNGSLAVTKPTDLTKAHVKDSVILTPSAGTGYEVDYVWYCKAASSTTCSGTKTKVSLKDGKYYFPMPTYNVLVGVEFKPINYAIAKSCGAKGSLDAPSSGKMNESITFSLEPNKGYKVKSVSVTKNSGGTIKPSCNADSSSCSFTMPAEAVKITAEFEPRVYTITYESAEHVRFTLAPTEWTAHTVFTVSWEVDAGYDAYIDAYAYEDHSSLNVVLLQPTIVKYAMPSCNVKVEVVNVRLKEYKISTPDVNGKGTAALSKTSGIHYDDEIVLTLTPGEGYEVSQIDIQSASSTVEEIEAATDENPLQYSLKKVAENQYSFRMPDYEIDNISVTFKAIEYNVTIGYAEHGDIAILTGATKSIDEEVLFAIEPHEGYEIDFFEVVRKDTEEEIATSNEGSKYTFVMPASDVFVSGGFKAIAASSSSETESSSSEEDPTSSEVASSSSDAEPTSGDVASSSSEAESSSSAKTESSSSVASSSSVKSSDSKSSSSSAKVTSSSSAESSSSVASSNSVKSSDSKSSSSSAKVSSSSSSVKAKSSSSSAKAKSSSSKKGDKSSSSGKEAVEFVMTAPQFSVTAIGRDLQIAGAKVGSVYAVFDMQGRVMTSGRVESANFNMTMARAGNYILRIAGQAQRVTLR